VWSADSRYLGAAVLDSWSRDPVTGTIVIDADDRAVVARSEVVAGFLSPTRFVGRSLCYQQKRVDLGGPYATEKFLRF
jgi:hypothetical protein